MTIDAPPELSAYLERHNVAYYITDGVKVLGWSPYWLPGYEKIYQNLLGH